MQLLELRGGYLYEHRPDIVPHGYLTDYELCLWSVYYDTKAKERKGGKC